MKLFRSFVIAAAVGLALSATADHALAGGPKGCSNCGGIGAGGPPRTLFGGIGHKQPAFQAAPWYLYWPYDGHFMTPAPVNGAFYGPPVTGNFPVNPYFPGGGPGYQAPAIPQQMPSPHGR
ncbi:hypothetical protein VT84_19910 [Gemmata sp. SH-PL17]|uniref:hypothetical protein n=1 Tax=Gemmata sp. SH-PL17 TaxID=1630693 RepID=UPI0004AF9170|nr:hypothetical protein [Gemmata sp. SH-PL17]AMV26675.1 hypothetical protein VT84_19910 [Gemmata sp. SH-PL17]